MIYARWYICLIFTLSDGAACHIIMLILIRYLLIYAAFSCFLFFERHAFLSLFPRHAICAAAAYDADDIAFLFITCFLCLILLLKILYYFFSALLLSLLLHYYYMRDGAAAYDAARYYLSFAAAELPPLFPAHAFFMLICQRYDIIYDIIFTFPDSYIIMPYLSADKDMTRVVYPRHEDYCFAAMRKILYFSPPRRHIIICPRAPCHKIYDMMLLAFIFIIMIWYAIADIIARHAADTPLRARYFSEIWYYARWLIRWYIIIIDLSSYRLLLFAIIIEEKDKDMPISFFFKSLFRRSPPAAMILLYIYSFHSAKIWYFRRSAMAAFLMPSL